MEGVPEMRAPEVDAPAVVRGGHVLAVGAEVPEVKVPEVDRGSRDRAREAEVGAPEVVPEGRDLAVEAGVGVPESVVGLER